MRAEFLDDCLVDSIEVRNRRKATRREGLVAAIAFESMALLALTLYPLLTPAKLRSPMVSAPIPGPRPVEPITNSRAASTLSSRATRSALFSPPSVPTRIVRSPAADDRNQAPPTAGNFDPGLPFGVSENPGSFGGGTVPIAPPAAAPVRVIHRSERMEEAQIIRRVVPAYPEIARIARISGTVELLMLVGRDGLVKSVEVLSGSPLLAKSAIVAVEQWRYRPTILDGEAVEVKTRVTIHFVLNE